MYREREIHSIYAYMNVYIMYVAAWAGGGHLQHERACYVMLCCSMV